MQLIDWITVVAQIVNFLILVALLKYFLYGRVLAAMQTREQMILAKWEAAEQDRELAAAELEEAQSKNRDLAEQRDHLLAGVREEVDQYRQQQIRDVRADVQQQQIRWSDALREESAAFLRDLSRRASQQVCAIARRALADLAGRELELCIVQNFLKRLRDLNDSATAPVIASLRDRKNQAIVQTSFELPEDLQADVAVALRDHLSSDVNVRFEQSSDLICGIALQAGAHKLAWELRDYLDDLEQELQQALQEEIDVTRLRHTAAVEA